MADLADQIDDYICSFEGVGDLTMDTLAMLIFAWAVLALFLVWLCKFLYQKYVRKGDGTSGSGNLADISKIGTSPSEKIRKSEPRELVAASKDIKGLDLALKSTSKLGAGIGGAINAGIGSAGGSSGLGGGILKTSPRNSTTDFSSTTRKRLSRKSPGPELRKPNRSILPPSNVIGPETSSVTWTSQVFRWLYSDLVIVNELLHTWVLTINETMKKTVETAGVAVEVIRVLPESPPPNISNIFCQSTDVTPSEMVTTMDCEAMPVFQVKTFRQKAGKVETFHYKATVSRLRCRLLSNISYNTLKGDVRIEGFPDIRITLNSIGAIKALDQDEKQLQEVISEILCNAIRDSLYPVDFSIYSTCPRAMEIEQPEIPVNYPIHYDSLAFNMENLNPSHQYQASPMINNAVPSGKRLLVKVVKGEGLQTAKDPYCVIEMDEPPQKNQTGTRAGQSPYWDEHFLFDLSNQSAEILFEIYDRPVAGSDVPKFLGLGLVGIDELAVGPASSQILTLQPRPYETEAVSGAITVEFVFIEGAEVPAGRRPYKFKEALKITNPAQLNGLGYQNGNDLADTAIRALEGGALTTTGNPSKSTLIIHSVQRNKDRPYYYRVELNNDGQIEMQETNTTINDSTNDDESFCHRKNEPESMSAINSNDEINIIKKEFIKTVENGGLINDDADFPVISTKITTSTTMVSSVPVSPSSDDEVNTEPITEPITDDHPHQHHFSGKESIVDGSIASAAVAAASDNDDDDDGGIGGRTIDLYDSQIESDHQPGEPIAQSSPMNHQTNGHQQYPSTNNNNINNNNNNNSLNRPGALQQRHQEYQQLISNNVITDPNDPNSSIDDDRGRTRKKRDFFGTLKRKLGRSKSRAKSMDRGMIPIDTQNDSSITVGGGSVGGVNNGNTGGTNMRSISADRAGTLQSNQSPGQRLVIPTLDQSRRSSLSESSAISGFSSASTKTYVHEASTLVLETIENGVKRHFLVPLAIAQRPRWRRKGIKLHIYNDHTFVAKHLSGGLSCDVCNRSIPRRPGKQGYECRDCMLKCHKQCHVRVPQACSNPTVLSMELSKLNSAAADRSIRKQ